MKNTPLISIIITCYNQEKYISQAIHSVVSQTYTNWECIVVDDGSLDASASVIKEFCKKDERIHLIRQENKGVAAARNTGFAKAKGDYIQFLDGDDTLLPEKFNHQLRFFTQHPDIGVCVCDHQYYYFSEQKYEHYAFEPLNSYPLEQLIYRWQNSVGFTNHAPLYKRTIWQQNELPFPEDYTGRSEDWIFNILVALKNVKYGYLNEILCNYHIHTLNFTTNVFESASSAIQAAFYVKNKLPVKYQHDFIEKTIKKSFHRYLESKKPEILRSSGNWRLGNYITKPFFVLKKWVNR